MAKAKKRSLINGLIYSLNILAALGLLASYLAFYVPPNTISIFAFFALAYPILLGLNILFTIYWALRLKIKFILSALVIIIGLGHFKKLYKFKDSSSLISNTDKLKLMSYNVRMFNSYQWIPEEGISEKIKSEVISESPDILMIQEYYKGGITPDFGFKYSFVKPTNISGNYGLSIFSNYPIVNTGALELRDLGANQASYNNQFIFADIDWNGRTIRTINIHLASIGLETSDYQRLQNPNEGSQEEIKDGFLKIVKQLDRAFKKRAEQIIALKRAINSSPYPVIVCGDFNDTPQSYTYHQVDLLLEDSFVQEGEGFGKTYARGPIPFRIDYIFHSDEFKTHSFKVGEKKLSDHFPVIAEIGIQ
tara:strand:+ start:112 stop:1200 length:1089 start_codon:yes stop_codon:yes gene_type:complete